MGALCRHGGTSDPANVTNATLFLLGQQNGIWGGHSCWFPCGADGAAASSKELLETTKDLRVKQQQAVDQLQVVQDQLGAQKAETKKLSEQIAVLTERLDALRQSIATKSR